MKSEFKKDDCVTLHIEDIGTGGEGIGKADGFTFFVKDAIVGDVIEAKIMKLKKNYGYARLMKVLTRPCRAEMSGRKAVRRLSDTGNAL